MAGVNSPWHGHGFHLCWLVPRLTLKEETTLTSNSTWVACFNENNKRRTWIVVFANLFPLFFGLDLLGKSSYFLQTIGISSSASLLVLIGGVVAGIFANGLGIWVMSRTDRRPSVMVSMAVAAMLWLAASITGCWRGLGPAWAISVLLLLVIIVSGIGSWPAAYAIMGETSALQMRAKTQAIGGVAQQGSSVIMGIILPYVNNPDAGDMGGKTGFMDFGMCLLAVFACFWWLPETKGRTSHDIDQMYRLKLPARRFKYWKP